MGANVFYYLSGVLALTNDSQIATLTSYSSLPAGFTPAAGWRHAATYYMTLTNWTAASAINIDTAQRLPGYDATELIFGTIAGGSYIPRWGGPVNVSTAATQLPVDLASAGNYVVLAGSTITNTGNTKITGDVGLSPGSSVTGFPPGIIVGTLHISDSSADQAKLDLTTAYNDAAGRTLGPVSVSGNLGGLTLPPGLYKSTSSLEISSGDLTLDGQGDTNAVWIFQIASTLTTTSGRQVILSGGAKAANIFWQVGTSATLGTTSVFKGTIMADQAITMNTGALLEGRALARIAGVVLDGDTINADISTAINESNTDILPISFELEQNYPNPFNPTTSIRFGLPTKSHVSIKVYNLLGQEITSLVNEELSAGTHTTEWDGRDKSRTEVASGIYFYKLIAGDFIDTKKMMLIK
jgi:hypothetical protein